MNLPFLTPLSEDQLRSVGIGEPWTYGICDRVRFGELDALNHVNHTACLRWFETFRVGWLRGRGITDLTETAPKLVLRQIGVDYLHELLLGDTYVVTGRTAEIRTSSFTMEYAVHVLDGDAAQTRITAKAVLVMLSPGGGKHPLSAAEKARLADRPAPTKSPLPSFLRQS